ncbi:hypothetical protein [Halorubrum sp. Atlit-26R]|uniref:DUF7344 domain-containing protein n=1 Tax=Halorubrum sp. Atlit-26R TaxID=2282128 RepID=UPI000EF19094|nr:hypothetical protein [Halorubrum sp. Atlit-26R]RLM70545.1 hypothetical protein DVK07_09000 [Halorubrum sp. Atlit-26R]
MNLSSTDWLTSGAGVELEEEVVFSVLSNRRRRFALHALCQRGDAADLGWLAKRVAAWEAGVSPAEVDSDTRKSCYVSLQQSHLPKMDKADIVSFDKRAGVVRPTPAAEELDIYFDVVTEPEIPWHGYYLGLAAVGAALLTALWTDAMLFSALPDLAWMAFLVAALVVSALAHTYFARRRKLGGDGPPPEVEG